MFRLNHANLPVPDVPALRDVFVNHFEFTEVTSRGRDSFAVLRGPDGFMLILMRAPEGAAGFPDKFHVGFLVDDPARVGVKHAELRAAGVTIGDIDEHTRSGFATTTFYCTAPGGILVEVSTKG